MDGESLGRALGPNDIFEFLRRPGLDPNDSYLDDRLLIEWRGSAPCPARPAAEEAGDGTTHETAHLESPTHLHPLQGILVDATTMLAAIGTLVLLLGAAARLPAAAAAAAAARSCAVLVEAIAELWNTIRRAFSTGREP
ncbi:hypothetical protein [Streptomyces sp. NPDC127112]|uniref:hypothetical protein n=1 Tax=Streptomyces sp. NPDC127112 TaxID=3345364 RepID=UPI00363D3ED5